MAEFNLKAVEGELESIARTYIKPKLKLTNEQHHRPGKIEISKIAGKIQQAAVSFDFFPDISRVLNECEVILTKREKFQKKLPNKTPPNVSLGFSDRSSNAKTIVYLTPEASPRQIYQILRRAYNQLLHTNTHCSVSLRDSNKWPLQTYGSNMLYPPLPENLHKINSAIDDLKLNLDKFKKLRGMSKKALTPAQQNQLSRYETALARYVPVIHYRSAKQEDIDMIKGRGWTEARAKYWTYKEEGEDEWIIDHIRPSQSNPDEYEIRWYNIDPGAALIYDAKVIMEQHQQASLSADTDDFNRQSNLLALLVEGMPANAMQVFASETRKLMQDEEGRCLLGPEERHEQTFSM